VIKPVVLKQATQIVQAVRSAMSREWGAVHNHRSGYATSATKEYVVTMAHLEFDYLTGSLLVPEENCACEYLALYGREHCP